MNINNNDWMVVGSKKHNSIKNIASKENPDHKKENYKKILCKNIIIPIECFYGNKCLYAHSLSEQKMDNIRKIAYDMITKDSDLSDINIAINKKIYRTLTILSKICDRCRDNTCTGGFNCKHGACRQQYVVCFKDMTNGTCLGNCNNIHLTSKGLVPYSINILLGIKCGPLPQPIILNDAFFINDRQITMNNVYVKNRACHNSDHIHEDRMDGDDMDGDASNRLDENRLAGNRLAGDDMDGDDSSDQISENRMDGDDMDGDAASDQISENRTDGDDMDGKDGDDMDGDDMDGKDGDDGDASDRIAENRMNGIVDTNIYEDDENGKLCWNKYTNFHSNFDDLRKKLCRSIFYRR